MGDPLIAIRYRLTRYWVIILMGLLLSPTSAHANDNLIAYQLYQRGEYARAAEIFTDPAWKGVAFYRSEQWWRAAEAFVRAADPQSAVNLGNSYVKLGYFELALEAYLTALSLDPNLVDAKHNAEVMRKLLALKNNDKQTSGRQTEREELASIDADTDPESGGGGGDEQSDTAGKAGDSSTDSPGEKTQNASKDGTSGNASNTAQRDRTDSKGNPGGTEKGEVSNREIENQPSGSTESDSFIDDSQAAGLRNKLESEQATAQWLNLIQHDAPSFLRKRIALEQRRRQEAGQAPPEGGSNW